MILVDTSAWISHLRKSDARLVTFLLEHRVRTCDVVVGELMLGSGLPRNFSRDLMALPRLPTPSAAEARAFIECHRESLAGSGVGWAAVQRHDHDHERRRTAAQQRSRSPQSLSLGVGRAGLTPKSRGGVSGLGSSAA